MRKQWFEEWFETDYYKLLYSQRDAEEARRFAKKLSASLMLDQQARILDVGCGRARYAKAFSDLGFDVTGIDISAKKIGENLKYQNDKLHFFIHDMRRLFRVNYFDAVLSLFTSFGYFESVTDEKNAARSMVKNLKWGGYLVIDFLNPGEILKNFIPYETITREGIHFQIHRILHSNKVQKEILVDDHGNLRTFIEQVRLYTLNDLIHLFEPFQMRLIKAYGNYQLLEYEENSSERMILIFQKFKQ